MARPIQTHDWWPATLALVFLSIPSQLLGGTSEPDGWQAITALACTVVGACLLGVGGYRIFKWAGSE